MSQQNISVKTPWGVVLRAEPCPDPNYPGIWIVTSQGGSVLVEYNHEEECILAHVWTKKDDEEGTDPSTTVRLLKKEEIKSLREEE